MTKFSERSGLFKFFYIILRVITFPIFVILFIFTHPLWLLVLLLMAAGGLYYWPMSQGVKTEEMLGWYQEKFVVLKKDVVKIAKEKGMTDLVPQAVIENVAQIEDEEARKEHGENYNIKIEQDDKSLITKAQLKGRRGFKKAVVSEEVKVEKKLEDMTNEEVLQEGGTQGGGLAGLVAQRADVETASQTEGEGTENATALASDGVESNAQNTEATAEAEPEINLVPKEEKPASAPAPHNDDDLELF